MSCIDFPFSHSMYVINIIIVIIIIISSSVCWALHSAETNGQYLSWETRTAAWSPHNVCLERLLAHHGGSSAVLRQAFLW